MQRHRSVFVAAALASAAVLLGVGLWLDAWWVIAGGVVSAAGAAFWATEPTAGDRSS